MQATGGHAGMQTRSALLKSNAFRDLSRDAAH
jgi:hypothetical protein